MTNLYNVRNRVAWEYEETSAALPLCAMHYIAAYVCESESADPTLNTAETVDIGTLLLLLLMIFQTSYSQQAQMSYRMYERKEDKRNM